MSDSWQPHGLQPTRLLHPWDSPGKSTGVGSHFLLQGIFPTWGSNPGLPHCRQMLKPLSHQGLKGQRQLPDFNSFYTSVTEKAMAPHSSTLAWKIPWTEKPGGLQSIGSQLSNFTFTFHFLALEKEMATHSSVLAWRIPGMGEPGGLPSMGSHRVRHD